MVLANHAGDTVHMTVWMQAAHVFVIRRPRIRSRLSRRIPHVVANGRREPKGRVL